MAVEASLADILRLELDSLMKTSAVLAVVMGAIEASVKTKQMKFDRELVQGITMVYGAKENVDSLIVICGKAEKDIDRLQKRTVEFGDDILKKLNGRKSTNPEWPSGKKAIPGGFFSRDNGDVSGFQA